MVDRAALEEILDRKLQEAKGDLLESLAVEFQHVRDKSDQLAQELVFLRSADRLRPSSATSGATSDVNARAWGGHSSLAYVNGAEVLSEKEPIGRASEQYEPAAPWVPERVTLKAPEEPKRPSASKNRRSRRSIMHYLKSSMDRKSTQEGFVGMEVRNENAEDRYESIYELARDFRMLCKAGRDSIGTAEMLEMCANHRGLAPLDPSLEDFNARMAATIPVLNQELEISPLNRRSSLASVASKHKSEKVISLDTFIAIMQWKKDICCGLDKQMLETAAEMRNILVRESTLRKVAHATNLTAGEICQAYAQDSTQIKPMERVLQYMDPIIGLVILANAVVICISTDIEPQSKVWVWFEWVFTVIFMVELCVRLVAYGARNFFLGASKWWNLFDTIVVCIAAVDMILGLVGTLVTISDFTIIRLLRFARLTKLVRVLKLKMFKELALMVAGLLEGFRVLVWAMVFLGFLLFTLGVVLTQTIGRENPAHWKSMCEPIVGTPAWQACKSSSEHLHQNRDELFGNVFRSMFTVFRCFTDGCNSVDGSPLIPYFYNTYGTPVVFLYMIIILFVMFGLFNLIMAIFVENTIDNAKRNELRARRAKEGEHMRVAVQLQELIALFCLGEQGVDRILKERSMKPTAWAKTKHWVRQFFSTSMSEIDPEESMHHPSVLGSGIEYLSLEVTHEGFVKVFQTREVQEMLDELDICSGSRMTLFEILDANCNGTLEVSELVQGLLKLRGTDSKGDSVAALLAIRSMQQSIKAMETLCLDQQQTVHGILTSQRKLQVSVDELSSRSGASPRTTARPSNFPVAMYRFTQVPSQDCEQEGTQDSTDQGLAVPQDSVDLGLVAF